MGKDVFTLKDVEVKEVFPSSAGDDYIDWGLEAIQAPKAWAKARGKGIKVAILDTGIDLNHPDLKANIKAYQDFTGSPYGITDRQGHGSHVAGLIAGVDNGIGIIGVAPEAELYIAKVLGDNGSGSFYSIINGLHWAIQQKVDIISMSLGCESEPPVEMHAAIKAAKDAGIILVAATGNENHGVDWPGMYDETIAVSAMNQQHERAYFSNYGIKNEIMAPGVDILSTYKDGRYARLSGTSMATPIISGSIAIYLSFLKAQGLPKPTLEEMHAKLLKSTDDLAQAGKDVMTGDGLMDLVKLLA